MGKFKVLSNGIKIPSIGFGTYKSGDNNETAEIVKYALECGYRQIDTASFYGNEVGIGNAIKESKVKREDIFLVTKLWNDDHGYDKTIEAFNNSLKRLQVEYLDLYLIHWPNKLNAETWRAFEDLYKAGKIKAIGVSNFKPHHLEALMKTEVKPMVNQIEFHPGFMQEETVKYCRDNGILVEAWSPLGTGRMLTNPDLQEIASHYGKSVAQICIRWCIQHDVLPLPKSVTPSRIEENSNVFPSR